MEENTKTRKRVQKKRLSGAKLIINDFSWKEAKIAITLLALTAIIILVGIAMFKGKISSKSVSEEKVVADVTRYLAKEDTTEIKSYVLRPGDITGARNVLDSFLSAKNVEEASIWVRNKKPLFNSLFTPFPKIYNITTNKALEYKDGSRSVLYFLGSAEGGKEIHLYAEPEKDFKVDWNSLYLCGSVAFSDFVSQKDSKIQDVYCYINVDTYYTSLYPEREYQSLELMDYTGESLLFGYVKRDTYMDDKLANAMLESDLRIHNKISIRALLTLKYNHDAIRPTAEIIDVLATDWVEPLKHQ